MSIRRGYYAITSVEIYTSQADKDLTDWRLQVKPWGSMRLTETVIDTSTNAFGFLRVVLSLSRANGFHRL